MKKHLSNLLEIKISWRKYVKNNFDIFLVFHTMQDSLQEISEFTDRYIMNYYYAYVWNKKIQIDLISFSSLEALFHIIEGIRNQ